MKRSRKLVVLLCLVVLGLSRFIYMAVFFQFSSSSNLGIVQPDIILEQGTSGNSTVYSNGTSASISVDSYSTTFFPNDYNVAFGDYVSGSIESKYDYRIWCFLFRDISLQWNGQFS